jgi:hypothetical protein
MFLLTAIFSNIVILGVLTFLIYRVMQGKMKIYSWLIFVVLVFFLFIIEPFADF